MLNPDQNPHNSLKTDLYELTMAAGYFFNKIEGKATFELSCHSMPPNRNYLLFSGLEQVVDYILNLRFSEEEIDYIKTLAPFKNLNSSFFSYLKRFRFTGDVWSIPEGEFYFSNEPILQVHAPIIEAQLLETFILATVNLQSSVATKASRIVQVAKKDKKIREVIDFGSRRAHGVEAGVYAARSAYICGCLGTSNVYAGKSFGIPLFGTVAHSWIEAFPSEEEAFKAFYETFPSNAILLIDTYDTLKAVEIIKRLPFKNEIKAIRLDSGEMISLSKEVRKKLDNMGLPHIKIICSGNLNEYKINEFVDKNAPVDFFGVGTEMVTSRDYPALDLTYKLVQIDHPDNSSRYTIKKSVDKQTIPGRKQIFREFDNNPLFKKDILGLFDETQPIQTTQLLQPIIQEGRLVRALPTAENIRNKTFLNLAKLSRPYHQLNKADHLSQLSLTQPLQKINTTMAAGQETLL